MVKSERRIPAALVQILGPRGRTRLGFTFERPDRPEQPCPGSAVIAHPEEFDRNLRGGFVETMMSIDSPAWTLCFEQ